MNRHPIRAALGITLGVALVVGLAIGAADFVLDDESIAAEPQAAMADGTESRTPIEVAALGPQIGEQVPDFRLPDQNGEVHTLDDILGPRGAMLLFHRSADW